MTLVLKEGENLENKYKVKGYGFGSGTLYVTSRALVIEGKGQGIYLHRWHNEISAVEAKGRGAIIVRWPEGRTVQSYKFRVWHARDIVKEILKKHNYSQNFGLEGVTHVMYTDAQRESIIKKRVLWGQKQIERSEYMLDEIINGKRKKGWFGKKTPDTQQGVVLAENKFYDDIEEMLKVVDGDINGSVDGENDDDDNDNDNDDSTTNDITINTKQQQIAQAKRNILMWKQYIKDAPDTPICRSLSVPKNNYVNMPIEDHLCWNNAWYDESTDMWCTLNHSLITGKLDGSHPFGVLPQSARHYEDTRITTIPYEDIRMFQGMPYVITRYDIKKGIDDPDDDDNKNDENTTLPTIAFKRFAYAETKTKNHQKTLPIYIHTLTGEMENDAVLHKTWRMLQYHMTTNLFATHDVRKKSICYRKLNYAKHTGEPMIKTPSGSWVSKNYCLYMFKRGSASEFVEDVMKKRFPHIPRPTVDEILGTLSDDVMKWGE